MASWIETDSYLLHSGILPMEWEWECMRMVKESELGESRMHIGNTSRNRLLSLALSDVVDDWGPD